jgi:hypothetical protein
VVTQESSLFFKGRKIVTERVVTEKDIIVPVIEIDGAADIADGVTLGGRGILTLESGGHLAIEGAVESEHQIILADGTGRVSIGNPTAFLGTVGFTPVPGARVDFPGIQAQSVGVDSLGGVQVLKLYAAPNQTGNILTQINVQSINEQGLLPSGLSLTKQDFALSSK